MRAAKDFFTQEVRHASYPHLHPPGHPRQRELWQLAFGDDGAYVDNFYTTYYRPERMLMLEENGVVQAMTAWFDTTFVIPEAGSYRAAYLYAVATHPAARGRGLAGRLLSDADGFFRAWHIPAVTTVPAEPSLHTFFGKNGFRECFTLFEGNVEPEELPSPAGTSPLRSASPAEYGAVRERILAGLPTSLIPRRRWPIRRGAAPCLAADYLWGRRRARRSAPAPKEMAPV